MNIKKCLWFLFFYFIFVNIFVLSSVAGQTCFDEDKGINLSARGAVVGSDFIGADDCVNTFTVLEYWCEGSILKNGTYACPLSTSCNGGRCVASAVVCLDSSQCASEQSCTDSVCVSSSNPNNIPGSPQGNDGGTRITKCNIGGTNRDIGWRGSLNSAQVYCGTNGNANNQKAVSIACSYSYECLSNKCALQNGLKVCLPGDSVVINYDDQGNVDDSVVDNTVVDDNTDTGTFNWGIVLVIVLLLLIFISIVIIAVYKNRTEFNQAIKKADDNAQKNTQTSNSSNNSYTSSY